jgi:hypothetical protein
LKDIARFGNGCEETAPLLLTVIVTKSKKCESDIFFPRNSDETAV